MGMYDTLPNPSPQGRGNLTALFIEGDLNGSPPLRGGDKGEGVKIIGLYTDSE